jgi:acetylornithine deacetylase
MTYGADMGLLANVGSTPTVLFGAGDIRRAHRPDEYVEVKDLVAMAQVLAVAALRFCGTSSERGQDTEDTVGGTRSDREKR